MSKWFPVGRIDDIPRRGARVVSTAEGDVAIIRTNDDFVFAVADQCPHRGGPLSQGIVHGHKITCPLHNWVIDLESGEAVKPDEGCVTRFAVQIENGEIRLSLEKLAKA
jgi:nitrite reductase (NADH) small subunit